MFGRCTIVRLWRVLDYTFNEDYSSKGILCIKLCWSVKKRPVVKTSIQKIGKDSKNKQEEGASFVEEEAIIVAGNTILIELHLHSIPLPSSLNNFIIITMGNR